MGSNCGGGSGGGGNPPVVRLVEPAGPGIGDPVGAARTFTASCTQSATMRVYLNGNLVHTSAPSVQQVAYTFPSGALGQHMVRVTATNARGSGENYWTWNVLSTPPVITSLLPGSDCLIDTAENFFQRTFEINTDIASKIRVYVNGVLAFAQETYSTVMSWIFDRTTTIVNPDPFVNIIRIIVENTNGTTESIIYSIITQAPVTSAPVITDTSPAEHTIANIAGSPGRRTFGVTVDQPTTIIFSVDGQEKPRFNAVTNAMWECDFSGYSTGIHNVVVTASNSNGSDSFTWSWNILPLVITLEEPATQYVNNYDTSSRLFRASLNTPARLTMYFDDRPIERPESEVSTILHEFKTVPLGNHTIRVVAEKDGVSVENFWRWNVSEYPSQDIIYCECQQYSGLRSLRAGNVPLTIEKYLNFYSNSEMRCQKAQLPDGSWIYLFALSNVGLVIDNDSQLPPIVINAEARKLDIYLSGFAEIELSINEISGNEHFVLFSSIDKYCVGISPLKGGNLENYYRERADLEVLVGLVGFLPYVGALTNLAELMSPKNYLSEIESINYSFGYEATMESNGKSPDGGKSPYVENQFRWVVWVQPECCVRFNVMMKLVETYVESLEISKDIQITAGESPVVL
ncbi:MULTISPECIES: hypothetical protein [unclassified Methanoculleus]|jgi:PKD repeat protein|uniref:hypothetical protein n=1 Tax=unclassified Methanoculleus TaxID=2619537 RepID=UPI0025DF873D|nr:hypothetical protein [Methanoculleus sp. UBA377]